MSSGQGIIKENLNIDSRKQPAEGSEIDVQNQVALNEVSIAIRQLELGS